MEVGLAIEMDGSIERLHPALANIATNLKAFFASKQYGPDLLHIFIGVVLTHPDSVRLHPIQKPSFRKIFKYRSFITKEEIEMQNVFQYEVRPEYERLRTLNTLEARRMLCNLLIESTAVIEANRASFPEFDLQQFQKDFRSCLQPLS